MRKGDFLYGCRSGIQKAIRRGDLDLGRTCFDALWNNKTHRSWLKWRTPVLVMEESSYLIGELAEFLGLEKDDERSWRKFLYELILSPKAKDGAGLLGLAKLQSLARHEEIDILRPWFKNNSIDPAMIVNQFSKSLNLHGDEYEMGAVRFLQWRVGMGGMLFDRQLCLTNMVLIWSRGLDKINIRKTVDRAVGDYVKKNRKPEALGALPWYVFDMHTVIGRITLSVLGKRKCARWGITEDELRLMWFILESSKIPKDKILYPKLADKASVFDSMWWIPAIRDRLKGIKGLSIKSLLSFWKREVLPEVRSTVEFVLQEREGN